MQTSFFGKYDGPNAVSIAGEVPEGYTGRQYKKLAPKYWFWEKWHNKEITDEEYTLCYYATVLNKLDARETYDELGEDAVMMCHEPDEKDEMGNYIFCHRHIVAKWFFDELGIEVLEMPEAA